MFQEYMQDWSINPVFSKEYISLWPNWLGDKNLHKLDDVTETDWAKFNNLIRFISQDYAMTLINRESKSIEPIHDIEKTFSNYHDSINKEAAAFSIYLIPELDCLVSEDWDFTYILWHRNPTAIKTLQPYIEKAGLYLFHE